MEQHHERFDGTGYPHRLKGHEISLAARIVSVADVYEVMTAPRPYKRSMSVTAARRELVRVAGTQLDPVIVRAFLNVSVGRLWRTIGFGAWIAQIPQLGRLFSFGGLTSGGVGMGIATATTATVLAVGGVIGPAPGPAAPTPVGLPPAVALVQTPAPGSQLPRAPARPITVTASPTPVPVSTPTAAVAAPTAAPASSTPQPASPPASPKPTPKPTPTPKTTPTPTPDPWSCAQCTNTSPTCTSFCSGGNSHTCTTFCSGGNNQVCTATVLGATTCSCVTYCQGGNNAACQAMCRSSVVQVPVTTATVASTQASASSAGWSSTQRQGPAGTLLAGLTQLLLFGVALTPA